METKNENENENENKNKLLKEIKEIYIKCFPSNLFQKKIDVLGLCFSMMTESELTEIKNELNDAYTEFQKQIIFRKKFFFPIFFEIAKLKQPFAKNVIQYFKNLKSEINLRKDFMYNLFFYPELIVNMIIEIYLEDTKKKIDEEIDFKINKGSYNENNKIEKSEDIDIYTKEEENEKDCLRSLFTVLIVVFLDEEVLNIDDPKKQREISIKIDRILENIQFLSLGLDGSLTVIYTIILLILKNPDIRESIKKISHQYRFEKLYDFLVKYTRNDDNTFCILSTELDLTTEEGFLKTSSFFEKLTTCYMMSSYLSFETD